MLLSWFAGGRSGIASSRSGLLRDAGVSNLLSEPSTGGSGFRLSSLALGGVVAGVLIVATVVTVLSVTGGDKLNMLLSAATVHPHESTAEWVEDDVTAYASLNLRPGLSNLLKARDFFRNVVDFDQANDDFDESVDELSEMLGIDVRDGVLPVLGPELAAAFYMGGDLPPGNTDAIFFVGFMDMDVGRSIADAYIAKSESDGKPVRQVTVGGFATTVVNDEAYITIHDTEPYILVGTTQGVLERTLAMMAAPVNPLSESPDFIEAMDRLPDNRFISGYADLGALASSDAVETFAGPAPFPREAIQTEASQSEAMMFSGFGLPGASGFDRFAAALTVGKNDLRIDYAVKGDAEVNAEITVPTDSLNMIPGDLIGFLNVGGLRSGIEQVLKIFDADADEFGYDIASGFSEVTELDLQTDLLDPIGDELALVLLDLDSRGLTGAEVFEQAPEIAAALLIEVRDSGRMEATMDRIREIAAESGVQFTAVDVGGGQAWVAQVPEESSQFEIAYMFKDGFLVAGISLRSLEQIGLTADGKIDSIKDNGAYKRVLDTVGDDAVFTLFVESKPVRDAVRSFISPEDLAQFDKRYVPWFDKIDAFAMSINVDGAWAGTTMLVTFN